MTLWPMDWGISGRCVAGVFVALSLTGCERKITTSSESATTYHGSWRGEGVEMEITPRKTLSSTKLVVREVAGRFYYKNRAKLTLIDCSFEGLSGQDIVYDCGDANESLKVEQPPHQQDGQWKMKIAGVELTRM